MNPSLGHREEGHPEHTSPQYIVGPLQITTLTRSGSSEWIWCACQPKGKQPTVQVHQAHSQLVILIHSVANLDLSGFCADHAASNRNRPSVSPSCTSLYFILSQSLILVLKPLLTQVPPDVRIQLLTHHKANSSLLPLCRKSIRWWIKFLASPRVTCGKSICSQVRAAWSSRAAFSCNTKGVLIQAIWKQSATVTKCVS